MGIKQLIWKRPRSTGSRELLMCYLLVEKAKGAGNETLMICSPNDPMHKETRFLSYELDGVPHHSVVIIDVYDHPVKTIDEWCKEYKLE
jgi:hypothetical protein